jgi:hypothetical protein
MKSGGKKPTHFGVYIFNASELNFNPILKGKANNITKNFSI